jgi:phospholipid/cholesterol/gamma-HCH transport system substrate-binding protein
VTQFARNFLLGLTSIAGLVALATLLLLFGELEAVLRPRYLLTIDCTNAVGLRAGSTIELNGVPVGQVDRVVAIQHPEFPVRILALIDYQVEIAEQVKLYATSSLLGGSATLQLEAPAHPGGPVLATDGSAHVADEIRSRLIAQLTSELDSRMGPVVEAMREFEMLARNLNELVEPPDPDDRNIRTAVATLNEVLEQMHAALARATTAIDELSGMAGRLEADADTVVARLTGVADELTLTLTEARGLIRTAASGDGTVGQLLNNPDLYESLDDAAERMERTLRDLQLLLDKIRQDGLRVVW